jgi:hypothetical protein
MNINWVLATAVNLAPNVDMKKIKGIGSLWGSWRTWQAYQTDNVICHNGVKAKDLIDKKVPTVCNFYVPNNLYVVLDEPTGVLTYGGEFSHEVEEQDEIVAMHLAAMSSDIVLLLGFDWTQKNTPKDPQKRLLRHNYVNLVQQALIGNSKTQWVLVDSPGPIMPELANLKNLTHDTLDNVFGMLIN